MPGDRPGGADDIDGAQPFSGPGTSDDRLGERVLAFLAEFGAIPADEEPALAGDRVARLLVPAIADGVEVTLVHEEVAEVTAGLVGAAGERSVRIPLAAGTEPLGALTVWLADGRPFGAA